MAQYLVDTLKVYEEKVRAMSDEEFWEEFWDVVYPDDHDGEYTPMGHGQHDIVKKILREKLFPV